MRRIRLAGQLSEPISHDVDGVEAGGFLYISGMLPVNADGELVGTGDVIRQTEQVLDNVRAVLRAAGATFDDIVRAGVYVTNMAGRALINTVRRRYVGESRPASTLVEVRALAMPDALVEIDAVAFLTRKGGA